MAFIWSAEVLITRQVNPMAIHQAAAMILMNSEDRLTKSEGTDVVRNTDLIKNVTEKEIVNVIVTEETEKTRRFETVKRKFV